MPKVKTKVSCYKSISNRIYKILINLNSQTAEKNLIFHVDPFTVGIAYFEINRITLKQLFQHEFFVKIELNRAITELSRSYEVTKHINHDLATNPKLIKWLKTLGVFKIKHSNRLYLCPICEESVLSKIQEGLILDDVRKELSIVPKQDRVIDVFDYSNHYFCRNCKLEVSTDEDLDSGYIAFHLDDISFQTDAEIRTNLLDLLHADYTPSNNFAEKYLNILFEELFSVKTVPKKADAILSDIFELRDEVSDFEKSALVSNFQSILTYIKDHSDFTGVIVMLNAFLMNNTTTIPEYVDEMLNLFCGNLAEYSFLLPLLSHHYPEKFLARIDDFKQLGINDVSYRIILASIVSIAPKQVIDVLPKIIEAIYSVEDPIYSVYILEELADLNIDLLMMYKADLQELLFELSEFDGREEIEQILTRLNE